MRRSNSGMIRSFAASQSLLHGAGTVLSSVPLRMRPGVSASARQCLRFKLNACVPMLYSFRLIFHAIVPCLILRERYSRAIPILSSRYRWTKPIST